MKCVVIRGLGIFAVGRNFNEAWHWAATLEHSMQVLLLSRQAGMKT
jgi:ribulose-5-phosphate 4-epimerase/fuculose-1-phosphate aldolase